jgi:hypothetical protein
MNLTQMHKDFAPELANRFERAAEHFISLVMNKTGMSHAEACKVLAYYRKHKIVKFDAIQAVYTVKHGAFLEVEPLRIAATLPVGGDA